MKHIVIVGGKDSAPSQLSCDGFVVSFIQTAKEFTELQKRISVDTEIVDTFTVESIVSALNALNARRPVDAVVSFFEECLLPTAQAAVALGILSNPVGPVQMSRDKVAMRVALQDSDVPSVRFRSCTCMQDAVAFLLEVGGKVILKPATGSGSRGVALVETPLDVESAWAWLIQESSLPAILEEYVEGPEFSIETLSIEGAHEVVAITEKITSGAPHFVETGHQIPARLEESECDSIHATTLALLERIGHRWGPAHTELRMTRNGPVVIETQTRFGGDQIWEMAALVTGTLLAEETIRGLLGLPNMARQPVTPAAAIRFFTPETGVIGEVVGISEAKGLPGVVRVDDSKLAPGCKVGPLGASSSRCGYVLAQGASTQVAMDNAENAASQVQWTIKKTHLKTIL